MIMFTKVKYSILFSLVGFVLLNVSANASYASPSSESRFNIYLSAYRPKVDTSIRLDSDDLNLGTEINLEDTTRLDDRKTLGAVSLSYQISERFWIEASYFELSRSGKRQLEAEIQFGDEIFEVDETIDTTFDVDITRIGVGYAFYNVSNVTFGLAGGLHITRFDVGIAAQDRSASEGADETAPLPYIGVNIRYQLSPRWSVGGQTEVFGIEIDDIDGSLVNANLAVGYKFNRNVSIGAGYNYYQLKVSSDSLSDGLSGEFEYTYGGPLLFLRLGF